MRFRPEILLFLVVWLTYGVFIKTGELEAYGLQQMGVDAIVEHGTFTLGHSHHPLLQPRGDVFQFEGRLHAAKQPGQFVIGAIAYAPLRLFGLSYDRDYVTTSAWVTWLSSASFAAAAVAVLVLLFHRLWGLSLGASVLVGAVLAFGTPLFAYSGVAHHDVIAGALLIFALTASEAARRSSRRREWILFGAFCGLAIFVSMLPALIVLVFLLSSLVGEGGLVSRARKVLPWAAAGFAAGIAPLAAHNWFYFHSPLRQANTAGNYADTFFRFSWPNFSHHLHAYLGTGSLSLWLYAPFAGLGLLLLALHLWREKNLRLPLATALVGIAAHFAYILNIETTGHCQFGPRYLLPCFALFMLAAAPAWRWAENPGTRYDRVLRTLLIATAILSLVIGFTGARSGTMLCDLSRWIPGRVFAGAFPQAHYPLRGPMLLGLSLVLFLGPRYLKSKKAQPNQEAR